MTGRITKWVGDRGFGFVADENGAEYFVHISGIINQQVPNIGDRVSFTLAVDQRSQRTRAEMVQFL